MWTEEKGVTDSDFGGSGAGKQPSEQASHDLRARTHFYRLHRPPWYVEMTRTVLMSPMQTANLQARVPFRPCDSRLLFVFRHVHLCDLCMHAKCAWMLTGKTMEEIINMYSTKHDHDKQDPPFPPDAPASSLGFVSCT